MKLILSFFTIVYLLCFQFSFAALPPTDYVIDPVKNANLHNNKGINYLNEGYLYAAIQEFKMAIILNPNAESSGIYYNNIGKVYLKIGATKYAENAFEEAMKKNPHCLIFYKNLAYSYKLQGLLNAKLSEAKRKQYNPYYKILEGFILLEMNNKEAAKSCFKKFIKSEPTILVSKELERYLKSL